MRIIPLILALVITAGSAAAQDFQQRFNEATRAADDAQVDKVTAEWIFAEPGNPEIYISAANYYFRKAHKERVQLSTRTPQKSDFAVRDPKTGEIVGSMGTQTEIDRSTAQHSIDILSKATQNFPERMDIWFGLAYINKELDNFESVYAALEAAFNYATSHQTGLKWKSGQPLSKDPEHFIPENAQGYLRHYYNRDTPEDDERFLKLAKLLSAYFPKHPYPINAIAGYYAAKEQWSQALLYLEKAYALDPRDTLIMMNLGMAHAKLHENAKAKSYYQKVIASETDSETRNEAREKLSELK